MGRPGVFGHAELYPSITLGMVSDKGDLRGHLGPPVHPLRPSCFPDFHIL